MNNLEQNPQSCQTDVSDSVFGHLMLDIETMGNESFSSIVSIGALEFDIETGKTGKEFYVNVDLQSCMDLGLIVNASTIMWWLNQNEQARKDLTDRTVFTEHKGNGITLTIEEPVGIMKLTGVKRTVEYNGKISSFFNEDALAIFIDMMQ